MKTANIPAKEEVKEVIIENAELGEKVVAIDRISRTVKGGRRIRFRALVVVGDRQGKVGVATGKAADVQGAIAKARRKAEKTMVKIEIVNQTIAHPTWEQYGTSRVILKPASKGHSIIAGGPVRNVVELSGIQNIVSKTLGSNNALNCAMATFLALKKVSSKRRPRKAESKDAN